VTNPNSAWHFDFSMQQAMDNKSWAGYTNAYDTKNPSSNWQANVEWAKVMGDQTFFYAKITGGTALPVGEYVMMAAVDNGANAGGNGSIYMTTVNNNSTMLSQFAANPYMPSQQYQVMSGSMYMNDYYRDLGNGGSGTTGYMGVGMGMGY
jgi:hypothetical protein